ncbi:hypothetical protein B5M42_019915 [Paenibacillus athensensis]|uniref:TM2 domain-containing protein n=1 Tax=Paenibacillus athensensis TaxID=1967502 RepID=A0A4Y8Q062_9BACL|nr:hypothetical protein [Paenibacillus athensensis]MCD1261074.1 hypothetical protein [Paenibacillus athensensis]
MSSFHESRHPLHEEAHGERFTANPADPYTHLGYQPPYYQTPRKRKWLSGLFSLLMPGTGHFYLGLMPRGLFIMGLLIVDIFTIVTLVSGNRDVSIPMVTLFALMIPVIYFYNIFDALQSTDAVNRRRELGVFADDPASAVRDPIQRLLRGSNLGILFIVAGSLFFLFSAKPRWFEGLFSLLGSYVGSVVLIIAGLVLFMLESRKK